MNTTNIHPTIEAALMPFIIKNDFLTKFSTLNELKTKISLNQPFFIENHIKPDRSRITFVKTKLSYFFTVDLNGKESWIINGAKEVKNYGFNFQPEYERVQIYFKNNNMPFVTLHFNEEIIKMKTKI